MSDRGPVLHTRALYDRFRKAGGDRPDPSLAPKAPLTDDALGITVTRLPFTSRHGEQLCDEDRGLPENLAFDVPVFLPTGGVRAPERLIVLLHGLNESLYNKLFPWAASLCRALDAAVAIFPMALHMTRRPNAWIDLGRTLFPERAALAGNSHASPFNAVLSARLHARPERFARAGLQTLSDLADLADLAAQGGIPGTFVGARLDFVGYSAGGYAALTLLAHAAARGDARFAQSRAALFATGADLRGLTTESLFILDGLASAAMRAYHTTPGNDALRTLARDDPRAHTFAALFAGSAEAKRLLAPLSGRVVALAARGDRVIDCDAITRNLSPLVVRTIDAAAHEYPFSLGGPLPDVYSPSVGRRLLSDVARSSDIAPTYEGAFATFVDAVVEALRGESHM